MADVAIMFFGDTISYYKAIRIQSNRILIRNMDEFDEDIVLIRSGRWWKILGYDQEHLPVLFGLFGDDWKTCKLTYKDYKKTCNLTWNADWEYGMERSSYIELINDTEDCMYGRLVYSASCDRGYNDKHFGAIRKMYQRILRLRAIMDTPLTISHREIDDEMYEWLDDFTANDRDAMDLISFMESIPREVLVEFTKIHNICISSWWDKLFGRTYRETRDLKTLHLVYLILRAGYSCDTDRRNGLIRCDDDHCLDLEELLEASSRRILFVYDEIRVEPLLWSRR